MSFRNRVCFLQRQKKEQCLVSSEPKQLLGTGSRDIRLSEDAELQSELVRPGMLGFLKQKHVYRFGKRKKAWDNWCLTNPQIPTWLNLCFKCRSDSLTPSGRSTVTQRYAKPHNKSPIVTVLIDCIVQVCVGFFFWYTPHWHTPVLYKTLESKKTICSKDHVGKQK